MRRGGGGGSVKLGTTVFSWVLKHDKQNLVQLSLQQRREIFKIRRGMLLRRKWKTRKCHFQHFLEHQNCYELTCLIIDFVIWMTWWEITSKLTLNLFLGQFSPRLKIITRAVSLKNIPLSHRLRTQCCSFCSLRLWGSHQDCFVPRRFSWE